MANNQNGMQDGQVNLAQLMQLPGATPIPPTNPINTSSVEDLAGERTANADVLLNSLNALTAQQARMGQPQSPANPMGIPKTSIMQEPWMKMAPVTGHGFFGGLKALFGDIGRGALAGVAATGPGEAIQRGIYGPGVARYGAQKQALADQIQTIKEQTQLVQQPIAAFGELAFHKALVASKEELNEIKRQALAEKTQLDQERTQLEREKLDVAKQKFTASRIDADRRFKAAMANINLRAKSLDERTLSDERNAALHEYADNLLAARIQAGYDEKTAQLETTTDIANARMEAEHPAQRFFGSVPQAKPGQRRSLTLPQSPNVGGSGKGKGGFDWNAHPVAK